MKLFGIQIGKSNPRNTGGLAMVDNRGSWWPVVREAFQGAWQKNIEFRHDTVLGHYALFACVSLIASDISKLCISVVKQDAVTGIWNKTTSAKYSDVLTKPNSYQNRIQFFENWIISKLTRGNAYILKERNGRGDVVGLYVLDPLRVIPLITLDGQVFYQLMQDNLTALPTEIVVPAREIIHDRFNTLFHPLVGLSPIFACGLASVQGIEIQGNSAKFFKNESNPSGILTAPGEISAADAATLKTAWEENYSGKNRGRVAVLGSGLKFERMSQTSVESQLVQQLQMTAEIICSTFHVPMYKIGVGNTPRYNNIQTLNLEYWTQCLQILITSIELCLDEGMGMQTNMSIQFDVDDLLRMDSMTQATVLKEQIGASILAPNEARAKLGLGPVAGGDSPMAQQQNYSLAALAKRDATDNPFANAQPAPGAAPEAAKPKPAPEYGAGNDPAPMDNETSPKQLIELVRKELSSVYA